MQVSPAGRAGAALLVIATLAMPRLAGAQTASSTPSATLFQNVRVFDGKSDKLTPAMSVLIEGNRIAKVAASACRRTRWPSGLASRPRRRSMSIRFAERLRRETVAHNACIMLPSLSRRVEMDEFRSRSCDGEQ